MLVHGLESSFPSSFRPIRWLLDLDTRTCVDLGVFDEDQPWEDGQFSSDGAFLALNTQTSFNFRAQLPLGASTGLFTNTGARVVIPELAADYVGPGDDRLQGEAAAFLVGGRGNDRLVGRGYLNGGTGNDRLRGEGPGRLVGGPGDDVLLSETGRSRLDGGAGDDRLEAGRQRDELRGGPGDDSLVSAWRNDELYGGSGDDMIEARDRRKTFVDCGPGHDRAFVDRRDRVKNCEVVRRAKRKPSS